MFPMWRSASICGTNALIIPTSAAANDITPARTATTRSRSRPPTAPVRRSRPVRPTRANRRNLGGPDALGASAPLVERRLDGGSVSTVLGTYPGAGSGQRPVNGAAARARLLRIVLTAVFMLAVN